MFADFMGRKGKTKIKKHTRQKPSSKSEFKQEAQPAWNPSILDKANEYYKSWKLPSYFIIYRLT